MSLNMNPHLNYELSYVPLSFDNRLNDAISLYVPLPCFHGIELWQWDMANNIR